MQLNNSRLIIAGALFLIIYLVMVGGNALADYDLILDNPLNSGSTVQELLKVIVSWLFTIAIPIAVAVIVYSGILFLTSKGDQSKVTKAREILKFAVIGLIIIFIGSGFITLIKSILELGAPLTP